MDWVLMVHPTLPADQEPGLVTKEAFELVHKPAGWRLLKPPKATNEKKES